MPLGRPRVAIVTPRNEKATISEATSRVKARQKKPKGPCELCGGVARMVHHKDEDPFNNDPANLENLCHPCHGLRHHHAPKRLTVMRTVREELIRLIRRHELNADELDLVCGYARRKSGLSKARKLKRKQLPKILPEESLKKFYAAIDKTGDVKHQIMLRLLFHTALRVSELTNLKMEDVDVTLGKIHVTHGKGDKERYVLVPAQFLLTLKTYMAQSHENVYLFESRQKRKFCTRQIQRIVKDYAEAAEIQHVHPHMLRHQMLTFLTSQGLSDSQIQLISGHSSKASLEKYQHLSLQHVASGYQEAMKKLGV
jgi:integrase/recombinase XerD